MVLADAMDAQLVVVARKHALGATAAQYVDDMGRSESLTPLRQARHAREQLLGLHSPVVEFPRFAAVVTCAARRRIHFIEIAQLDGATAFGRLSVAQDLTQLLSSDALFLFKRLAAIGVDLLLDQKISSAYVGR